MKHLPRLPIPAPALVAAAVLCWPALASAYEVAAIPGAAVVTGVVRYLGRAPKPKVLKITKDQRVCGRTPLHDESLLVGEGGGLRNAIVFFRDIEKGRKLKVGKATLQNKDCHYIPHVQAFGVGTMLSVKNADAVLHNTHVKLPRSDVLNYALPRKGQVARKRMRRKGLMRVGCDAGHTWMRAYIAVFDHPYFAVTDASGGFRIEGVPPGRHKVSVWHEKLGSRKAEVVVKPGRAARLTVVYK